MKIKNYLIMVCAIIMGVIGAGIWADSQSEKAQPGDKSATSSADVIKSVNILEKNGGRVSWSQKSNIIAFDREGDDEYFGVYTVRPDGTALTCLTCDKPGVPSMNNGNPAWHPSGKYIVLQVQDPYLIITPPGKEFKPPKEEHHKGEFKGGRGRERYREAPPVTAFQKRWEKYVTAPAMGINNNIWITTADGSQFWQITHIKERRASLRPQFSPDGTKLIWSEGSISESSKIGNWSIMLADFSIPDEKPVVSNIRTMNPDKLQFYEINGFSPDGKTIIFSGIEKGKFYFDMEIYTMDLQIQKVVRLTNNAEWDGYARYTPDGKHIIWASSEGITQSKATNLKDLMGVTPLLEYWIMDTDGSNKHQLTHFNNPANAFHDQNILSVSDYDWSPDGQTIASKVMLKESAQESIALISLALSN